MVRIYPAILLVTAVSAFSLGERDVTKVVNSLVNIATRTTALTTSINKWDGTIPGALGIIPLSTALGTAIDAANKTAAAEPRFSSADTQTMLDYLDGDFTTNLNIVANALISRNGDVVKLGLESLVLNQLQMLVGRTDVLGATLVAVSSADLQADVQADVDKIDAAFAAAVVVYS